MAYTPILGNAGTIIFRVLHGVTVEFAISVNVSQYEENYIECEGNQIVYDEDGNAIKNFVGFRKQIKFSVHNSFLLQNYSNMLLLMYNIRQIKTYNYRRISANYRSESVFANIDSCVFVELPAIDDVSKSSNIAEEFSFVIEDKEPIKEILFGQVTNTGYLLNETGGFLLNETGGKIKLEKEKYN